MTCGRAITDAQIFNLKENSTSLQQFWSGTSNSRYTTLQPEINWTWVFGSLGVACYCTDLPSRFIALDSCCHSVTPKSRKQRPCVIKHNLTLSEAHHHLQAVMAEIESLHGGIFKLMLPFCNSQIQEIKTIHNKTWSYNCTSELKIQGRKKNHVSHDLTIVEACH
jgi:hypothetical protein